MHRTLLRSIASFAPNLYYSLAYAIYAHYRYRRPTSAADHQADAVLLSRGNLGLDLLPEKMAAVQKAVISACNLVNKPIIASRVVDTMSYSPRPTRAEATDVANLVLDGE